MSILLLINSVGIEGQITRPSTHSIVVFFIGIVHGKVGISFILRENNVYGLYKCFFLW